MTMRWKIIITKAGQIKRQRTR